MAGNDWIDGYLGAILDTGATVQGRTPEDQSSNKPAETVESGTFATGGPAINYFINEITEFNELDLHRTWQKATATKNMQERGSRLENFCWRIWHLMRKKKQIAAQELQRQAQRQQEREEGRRDVVEDIPEEMESSDKQELSDFGPAGSSAFPGVQEAAQGTGQPTEKRLYVVMISLHGLVRGDNMELGRDSDTGGQIKYVVEFARALAKMPEVYRVDLLTRQITAKEVSWSYGEPSEMLTGGGPDDDGVGESSGAYIIRIPCGPIDQYIRKELLWPYVPEFVDGALSHVLNMSRALGKQIGGGKPVWPHMVHGHYADAGDIAALLSGALNVPMVLTGHSLGRNKLEQLLKQGRKPADIDSTYKIMRRIEAEELALDAAELVVTSTRQEIDEQWGLYDGFVVKLERVLRARLKSGVSVHGRFMPRMVVIPPGMDFSNVIVQEAGDVMDTEGAEGVVINQDGTSVMPVSPRGDPPIWTHIMHFLTNPRKPIILALARPDPKKNITTLVKAYGECRPLRELANLVLILGNRDDIDEMGSGSAEVLTTVLKLIDKYDMYGQVAYPKHHKQKEVPEIYRLAAKSKGVFVNPALVEPFGLTLIEAAAHGLPMVATKNGGPVDIQRVLSNGLLVDPHDDKAIADALLQLVRDRNMWAECRRSGLRNIHCYSWPEHCKNYLSRVAMCRMRHAVWREEGAIDAGNDEESQGDSLRDVQDLSLRLSMDGRSLGGGSITSAADLERAMAERSRLAPMHEEEHEGGEHVHIAGVANTGSTGMPGAQLRSRKALLVIAIDSYDRSGKLGPYVAAAAKAALDAVQGGGSKKSVGLAVATALTGPEVVAWLAASGIPLQALDVVIAGSGSELYYPVAASSEDKGPLADRKGGALSPDLDYLGHIEYRWGGEGLRKSMARVIAAASEESGAENGSQKALAPDEEHSGPRCLTYRVLDTSLVPSMEELRKRLRMRGYRCHVVYCRAATSLNLLPLHASRAQALRYLFVRWGLDVANMAVVVGAGGDTDYSELLAGTHRTVILGAPPGGPPGALGLMGTRGDQQPAPSQYGVIIDEVKGPVDSVLEALKEMATSSEARGSDPLADVLRELKLT